MIMSPKRVCLFTLNFLPAAMQLVTNGNVATLFGARTTFEIQPISINYYSLRISIFLIKIPLRFPSFHFSVNSW